MAKDKDQCYRDQHIANAVVWSRRVEEALTGKGPEGVCIATLDEMRRYEIARAHGAHP